MQSLKLPGPTITIGESQALGNDIVPFFTQTGTRQSLFEGSREASHVFCSLQRLLVTGIHLDEPVKI